MKNLVLIVLCFLLFSCFGTKENTAYRLTIDPNEVREITFQCGEEHITLNPADKDLIINKINSAQFRGMVKGIVRQKMTIYLKNNDTLNIRLLESSFKWNKSGDWTYTLDLDKDYLSGLCSNSLKNQSNLQETALKIPYPIQTIERIFNQYTEYQESTDAQNNLDSLKQSFKILEVSEVSITDLTLIVNVWMYYMVTDFKTLEYTEKVLFSHKEKSIQAVEERIRNKMEWETEERAQFSELKGLLERLKEN